MAEASENREKDRVSEAMDQVLEAERRAQEEIEEAREEAKRIVQEARTQAQQIENRADERITRAHRDYRADTEAAVDAILAEKGGNSDLIEHPEEELIDTAVARLATRLSGGANDGAA
ncbi:hypothetical protein [Dichotomicrobium thermohalophilum]|uniref:V/A-type H+-transporting ATPase subunit G/H n=1 Tax=Dichotomicrobium thermohalophilum TaxID=933063 RepID=A0A397Q6Q1_9HYPH|nr:hypothetical protein [Dichotomicrobium thermohalophilum]RIA56149.1 V/A-type H+-transporting ATPase subunit G/H [Dichotomicrobium thermohalophilum]